MDNKSSGRNIIFIYRFVESTMVVDYSGIHEVEEFLLLFDDYFSIQGYEVPCSDGEHFKLTFVCNEEFWEFAHNRNFTRACIRLGVDVTFNSDDVKHLD